MTVLTLAMFPGQGSQHVGMGKAALDAFPYLRPVFEEAEDGSRLPLRRLCFDGPESDLRLTAHTQPAILCVSVAYWRVLREEVGFAPDLFAGHSLGEYSALVAAGSLTLCEAAGLVRVRGEAMQSAVPVGVGAMAAIMGGTDDLVSDLCRRASLSGSLVEVANYNSPQQRVISGHAEAVARAAESASSSALKAIPLSVSAPFHSSLMEPARVAMTPRLEGLVLGTPANPVVPNVLGCIEDRERPEYLTRYLVEQIDKPVRWTQTLQWIWDAVGCRRAVEVGPGRVLVGLARRTWPREGVLVSTDSLANAVVALS